MRNNQMVGVVVVIGIVAGIVGLRELTGSGSRPGIAVSPPRAPMPAASAEVAASRPVPGEGISTRPQSAPSTGGEIGGDQRGSATAGAVDGAVPVRPGGKDGGQLAAGGAGAAGTVIDGAAATAEQRQEVVVQVAGAVKHPGVYHLAVGARNDDAVKAAGGLSAAANPASINLAAKAADGAQLYVRTMKEQPEGGAADPGGAPVAAPLAGPKRAPGTPRTAGTDPRSVSGGSRTAKLKSPSEGHVNINTASAEELQRIPHVGPAMAEKIIAFREQNHGFQSSEDLMQVKGIGAKTYNKMAAFVRVH